MYIVKKTICPPDCYQSGTGPVVTDTFMGIGRLVTAGKKHCRSF